MIKVVFFWGMLALAVPATAFAEYAIKRENDAPFTFTISGVTSNKGSSLQRETIVLNDPKAPVDISRAKLSWNFARSNFVYNINTDISAKSKISAISVRHIVYDLFGQHMKNLANVDTTDLNQNQKHTLSGTWNAYGNETSEALTIVTYVSRVRLSDGTQWVFDEKSLVAALGSLKLEQRVGEKDKPATP